MRALLGFGGKTHTHTHKKPPKQKPSFFQKKFYRFQSQDYTFEKFSQTVIKGVWYAKGYGNVCLLENQFV